MRNNFTCDLNARNYVRYNMGIMEDWEASDYVFELLGIIPNEESIKFWKEHYKKYGKDGDYVHP